MAKNKQKSFLLTFLCFFYFFLFVPVTFAAVARLNWNANAEPDLAGYSVYWGTSSGTYSNSQDIGIVNTFDVNNISDTGTTYFALRARDTSNNVSGFSSEVRKTPGDVDKDGEVTIFDYNTLKTNFGQTNCDNAADIDLSCEVDIFDYNTLKGNFGART